MSISGNQANVHRFSDTAVTPSSRRNPRNDAATGISAAGTRAITGQLLSFYFRAPVKAFFRNRVDYMAFAKAINPRTADGKWSLHTTTPGLLAHAVRTYGWRFIPDQILPPLLANAGVGAILYTSYLQTLSILHGPTSHATKRIYPPAHPAYTFTAGFLAGFVQSVAAAPLDALQVRFRASNILGGHYGSLWGYGKHKLWEIGLRGVFAGWTLSFVRESFGYGIFFSCFEFIKSQAYYSFITWYYGSLRLHSLQSMYSPGASKMEIPIIKPHYALEPCFLMLAGVSASVAQRVVQHPLSVLQNVHFERVEYLDHQIRRGRSKPRVMRFYFHTYRETFESCRKRAARFGGWQRWLFKGFVGVTVRQVPSASAGLVIFELVRRKYANLADAVRIRKDGYDFLLT